MALPLRSRLRNPLLPRTVLRWLVLRRARLKGRSKRSHAWGSLSSCAVFFFGALAPSTPPFHPARRRKLYAEKGAWFSLIALFLLNPRRSFSFFCLFFFCPHSCSIDTPPRFALAARVFFWWVCKQTWRRHQLFFVQIASSCKFLITHTFCVLYSHDLRVFNNMRAPPPLPCRDVALNALLSTDQPMLSTLNQPFGHVTQSCCL